MTGGCPIGLGVIAMKTTLNGIQALGFVSAILGASASGSAWAAPTDVTIMNFEFMPNDITITVGQTVTWTNRDAIEHTVTTQTGEGTLVPDGIFDSSILNEGDVFSYTFIRAGVYHYYCIPHGSSMQGIVRVAEAPCVGDFDADSDTDSDDISGFFSAWEAGDSAADADADGDTDSDDVIVFFAAWDSGC